MLLDENGKPKEPAKSFANFVHHIQGGTSDLNNDLSIALQEICAAMNTYQEEFGGTPKGKLKIEFKFKLDKGVFDITATHEVTLPKRPAQGAFMWSTPGDNFTAENPRQMSMFSPRDTKAAEG